ncbi:MAG: sulfotransferase [Woeseiaceae bacterium]
MAAKDLEGVMSSRPTLLYILAPSFSGSTLLSYLLAQHDAISTIGELKATRMGDVRSYVCSCGSLIRDCGFWSAVGMKSKEAGLDFSVDRFGTVFRGDNLLADRIVQTGVRGAWFEAARDVAIRVVPGAWSAVARIAHYNSALVRIICDLQGGPIFLDGSKDSVRLKYLIDAGLWQMRVIYLQRDGRGVSNSFKAHRNLTHEQAVQVWREGAGELQRMRRRLDPETVIDLHYEDLCRQPKETLQQVWRWLGIDDKLIQLNFKQGDFHILGNTMRLTNTSEIRLDECWRSALSMQDLAAFEQWGGALNRELGYE